MKCTNCSAEVEPGITVCPTCGAIRILERTPLGVVVGVLGIVAATLTAMMIIPLPLLMLLDVSLKGFPWVFAIIGIAITAGAFWYSNTTRYVVWHRRGRL